LRRSIVDDSPPMSTFTDSLSGQASQRPLSTHQAVDGSPSVGSKSFPVLPIEFGRRPSSTPITPAVDHFVSRPASPVKWSLGIRDSGSPLVPPAEILFSASTPVGAITFASFSFFGLKHLDGVGSALLISVSFSLRERRSRLAHHI